LHAKCVRYCPAHLLEDERSRVLFRRMAQRAQIEHRYSVLPPHADEDRLDGADFYRPGAFPDTETRMRAYERQALPLARRALDRLPPLTGVSHLIVATCTGFYAPGLDLQIMQAYGLSSRVERSQIGFMGCHAGLSALKLARHILRSEPEARVLVVCLELCSLHLKASG